MVVFIVTILRWTPLQANGVGWLCAFGVSFLGHHHLTFRDHGTPMARALVRFLVISATGFMVNQLAYALLLKQFPAYYRSLLLLVLLGVALLTFVLSRRWAFLRRRSDP